MYDADITEAIDSLQQKYECCGVRNHNDWSPTASLEFFPLTLRYCRVRRGTRLSHSVHIITGGLVAKGYHSFPSSCCKSSSCSLAISSSPEIYSQGCLYPVVNELNLILVLVDWSTIAISGYLVIKSFMVCCFRVAVPR